jgi:hypothetical protein
MEKRMCLLCYKLELRMDWRGALCISYQLPYFPFILMGNSERESEKKSLSFSFFLSLLKHQTGSPIFVVHT